MPSRTHTGIVGGAIGWNNLVWEVELGDRFGVSEMAKSRGDGVGVGVGTSRMDFFLGMWQEMVGDGRC